MKQLIIPLLMIAAVVKSYGAEVRVIVSGLEDSDNATISLASYSYLDTKEIEKDGIYIFSDVPDGSHYVKIEAVGYEANPSQIVEICNGVVTPVTDLRLVVTKQNDNPDEWNFKWEEDGSPSGYTQTSYVNKPVEIEFLGKKIVPAEVPSYSLLENNYHIYLDNSEETWTQEYAYRMVETLKTLPVTYSWRKYASIKLSELHIEDDILVTESEDGYDVTISKDAFYYANPFLVNVDGVRGRLFSKRLHHALTNFLTDFGKDDHAVEEILFNRFGCHVLNIDYEQLTKDITNEDAGRFQPFVPSELVSIINMYEELPEGFHKINNLKYLIRRQNGLPHPLYPNAAAVAWPVENGYIEFMESAFGGNNEQFETLRLILHEKSHFLWAFTFSEEIKNDWIELGGWYKDPNVNDGWLSTKDTEFVSPYAHAISPNEDMAESIAHYVKDPELLQSRALDKFEFIRDRIMHGTRYISKIPDHLTFEVLNLNPDYDYPGKIKKIEVSIKGAPDEDKVVTMRIELNDEEGFDDGASTAFIRLLSPSFLGGDNNFYNNYVDLWMEPADGNDHVLIGSIVISKYSKTGHWTGGDIVITDKVGNQRFEGRNDCVTDFYVNNQLEDLEPPKYKGDLRYILSETEEEGHRVQNLQVRCRISDNIGFQRIVGRLNHEGQGYSYQQDGRYDEETGEAVIDFRITEYFPSGDYWLAALSLWDSASTNADFWFTESSLDYPLQKIHIETPNPDKEHVELDLQRITVYAEPTHPEAPDGETLVTINFFARDDKSGLGVCSYKLRDPQGIQHFQYFYHRNFYTSFFEGDPTVWERYTIKCILPQGSTPGIWGLQELTFIDKAYNEFTYNFVETLIFEPDDNLSDYELFADIENSSLTFVIDTESANDYSYTWRIIHEGTGLEIDGMSLSTPARSASRPVSADLSEFPEGDLVLIVNILGEDSQVISIKTKRLNYKGLRIPVETIELSSSSIEMQKGGEMKLTATVIPEDATNKEIEWLVGNGNEVLSLITNGNTAIITALELGETTITARSMDGSDVSASVTVKVLPVPAESITLGGTSVPVIKERETHQLTADVLPDNTTYPEIEWSSSNTGVATVDQNGMVTAVAKGEVVITAKVTATPSVTATYSLTVEDLLLGDSNEDKVVDVFDVVNIANYIIGGNPQPFCFVASDVIWDRQINVADQSATINLALGLPVEQAAKAPARSSATNSGRLIAEKGNSTSDGVAVVSLSLSSATGYSAVQANVILPEGMEVQAVRTASAVAAFNLMHNVTADGVLRIILYSLDNTILPDTDQALVEIVIKGNGSEGRMVFDNVLASTPGCELYRLEAGACELGIPTVTDVLAGDTLIVRPFEGAIEIINAKGLPTNIIDMQGRLVKSMVTATLHEFVRVTEGLYIVKIGNQAFKVNIK